MSTTELKEHIILVIHSGGRSYVIPEPQLRDKKNDTTFAAEYVAQPNVKWSRERIRALELAHNIDNALHTEYGVRELFMSKRKRNRDAARLDQVEEE